MGFDIEANSDQRFVILECLQTDLFFYIFVIVSNGVSSTIQSNYLKSSRKKHTLKNTILRHISISYA